MPSGVYIIRNTTSGKSYIGSAVDISRRLAKHRWLLRTGAHPSKHLSASWTKYGEDVFETATLEECPPSALLEREQHWIDTMQPEYNKRAKANSNLGLPKSEESRLAHSKAASIWANTDGGRAQLGENSAKGWSTPEKRAARIDSLRAAWTPEKRTLVSEKQKGIDNGKAARDARWSKPGASERATASMKASWETRKKVTSEVIKTLCDERGLDLIAFDGETVTVYCKKHDHTGTPNKKKFVYSGQGCRFCGFERSSEKQKVAR